MILTIQRTRVLVKNPDESFLPREKGATRWFTNPRRPFYSTLENDDSAPGVLALKALRFRGCLLGVGFLLRMIYSVACALMCS